MLYALTGTVTKLGALQAAIDVSGVSYLVSMPSPVWDSLRNGKHDTVIIYTYVREDRLELFGFRSAAERSLFAELLNISGIGPKIALELCSIPMQTLVRAVHLDDAGELTRIKGIGKKTAEKLLVDLKSLMEKHPEWATMQGNASEDTPASFDIDAVAALISLGYDQPTVVAALKQVPSSATKTEERVAAALRSL